MRRLAVAMLKKGDRIILPMGSDTEEEEPIEFLIHQIRYSDPVPGTVTLVDKDGMEEPISAIVKVEVVDLAE